MKKVLLAGIIMVAISTTGCIQKYEYSEQQTDSIAEYTSAILIDSDEDYRSGFTLLGKADGETSIKVIEKTSNKVDIKKPQENISDMTKNASLNEVLGLKNINVEYNEHQYYTSYPKEGMDTYFSLTPREGNRLLVVTFDIKNLAKKTNEIKLIGSNVSYKLKSGEDVYKPLFTLLEDDLQHISVTLKKGETKSASLVFEVPTESKSAKFDFIVSKGKKTEVLKIK